MRFRRNFFLLLSVLGMLSFAFATPTYAFQEDNVQDDGSWCIDEGGTWTADGWCDWGDEDWDEGPPGEEWDEQQ